MAFITRNVSISLLLAIVASVAFLIATTVYYHVSLADLNQKYHGQVATLQEIEAKAAATTQDLNRAISERELRLARGSKFELTYGQLKSQEETTEALRDRRRQDKETLLQSIAASQQEFVQAKAQAAALDQENAQAQAALNRLVEETGRQENTLRSLKSELDTLQEQLKKLTS